MERITSNQNAYIKDLSLLSKPSVKKEKGIFLLEGEDFILEAYQHNCLLEILTTSFIDKYSNIKQTLVSQNIIDKLSQNKSSKTAIGICKYPTFNSNLGKKIVYLDGVQDPGNVGTIIRTALAFSYDAVILSEDSASLYNDKVLASSKGAIFALPIFNQISLQDLKDQGYQIIVSTLQEAKDYKDIVLQDRFVIVMGSEGQGVKESSSALATDKVKIAMSNIDSLNVGVAAGILLNQYRD